MAAVTRWGVVLLSVVWAACATPIRVETTREARDARLQKLALAPFSVGIPLARSQPGNLSPEGVAGFVTGRVLEALTLHSRFVVVPPEEVHRALMEDGPLAMPRTPSQLCARLAQLFGVDAILFGTVHRFVPRAGDGRGATRPAAVWFELELRTPEGVLLWSGSYDEIQQSVTQDIGSLQRASRRRFRWLSAEDLTRYGADELVRRLSEVAR